MGVRHVNFSGSSLKAPLVQFVRRFNYVEQSKSIGLMWDPHYFDEAGNVTGPVPINHTSLKSLEDIVGIDQRVVRRKINTKKRSSIPGENRIKTRDLWIEDGTEGKSRDSKHLER
jgi:hypothetical protein